MRKPNYCKGVIIVHGKCELLLAGYIKSNLHLPIEIYSENNGKTSIEIDGLKNILGNNIFKNPKNFKRKYIVEEKDGKIVNFFVIPIMDFDNTDKNKIEEYVSGKMFEKHWLSPYIIPIWNNKNLDEVLLATGLISRLPNNKEKGKIYKEIFPKNEGKFDKEQIEEFMKKMKMCNKTNLEILIEKCLESL